MHPSPTQIAASDPSEMYDLNKILNAPSAARNARIEAAPAVNAIALNVARNAANAEVKSIPIVAKFAGNAV